MRYNWPFVVPIVVPISINLLLLLKITKMASVKVLLRENKIKKNGEIPIYLRIIKNRRTQFISLGIAVLESQWDDKNSKVKKNHKNSARFNAFITHKKAEALDVIAEMSTKSKSVSTNRIKSKIMGLAPIDFFEYSKIFLNRFEKRAAVGSYKTMDATINKLKKYHNEKPLFMDEITVEFIKNYQSHLLFELKNSKNTVHGNLKRIRQIINEAIREDKFPIEDDPFRKIKLTKEPTKRTFLTESELRKIEDLKLSNENKLDLIRDMFIFSANVGLRISDILQIKWNNIEDGFFNLRMQKTRESVRVKMPTKALVILKKYKKNYSNPNNYVFPFLIWKVNHKDPNIIHEEISSATAYINKALKTISSQAEINKSISFHSARHTFATLLLKKGARIEYVSKLLGHSNIKETQIYAKIIDKDLEDTIDLLN